MKFLKSAKYNDKFKLVIGNVEQHYYVGIFDEECKELSNVEYFMEYDSALISYGNRKHFLRLV